MVELYESQHQLKSISNWERRGLICKEGQTYKDIYSFVMSIDRCERCGVTFDNENRVNRRCMDHSHKTGYFRQVLCHSCNQAIRATISHLWISASIHKRKSGNIDVYFQYKRKDFKKKCSSSLTKMIAYSFINLLKKPI